MHANHLALSEAGLRNPGRRGDLHANHLALFEAGLRSPGRRGDLISKMSHLTQNSNRSAQNSHYCLQQKVDPDRKPQRNDLRQLGESE
jgi:hypothetical protein